MNPALNALAIYGFLLLVFRVAGRRTLGQITTFDLVLLLVISESVQNALVRNDYSLTNAFVLILTLVTLDVGLSLFTRRFKSADRVLEGMPLVIVERGECLTDLMRRARVDREDVLAAARKLHGLSRLDQIEFAVLERSGELSIIPTKGNA
ncbi:hypothetical protein DAERI_020054 [Deinococcus aerius]|uniref:YetF C-terminal domain-containing protein n=2 Tax=Deinococcus TaxID=1298 RepID=A0A2I9DQH0_9DEIO|nr:MULTISPECIES: YetF domain-containing protein [Deinococcus]MBB5293663.1 uncharacterized membrane protein YcaP (DUF421 family) [Deinococcus metallilatus]QBY07361.1 DUF421 domain-containing protein [Deinococcus metallilatus]RXJ14834.1 DUF421 domain-containing protein [Deinococcus metallilatus]TLK30955.1 DUF421 domain-containing protein [Deinococcus metallilatus]GBF04457.1 hypothetical protein DAERI_020054 [Deinococcus aerius]